MQTFGGDLPRKFYAISPRPSPSIGKLAEELESRVDPLTSSAEASLGSLSDAIGEFQETAKSFNAVAVELHELVDENRAPIRDFSSGGLYELSQFVAEARVLVAGLTRLTAQIERDPARFFFGDTQKGFEPQ